MGSVGWECVPWRCSPQFWKSIGIRLDKHEEEIAAIKEELTDTKSRQDTYDDRLAAIESSLESVIASFEQK
jgi:chromosome segregation ATPase